MTIPYNHNLEHPPVITRASRTFDPTFANRRVPEETTRLLIEPDTPFFKRPYLAVPGVNEAFVWPLGIEGFEIQVDTQLSIHRYLGEVELDVSITHEDERRIQLSGVFPGWTSVDNMVALQRIYAMDTPAAGKVLMLPNVLASAILVVGENMRFTHSEDERTQDIAYTVSFIQVGRKNAGADADAVSLSTNALSATSQARGRGTRFFQTTITINTLRRVAQYLFRDASQWQILYSNNINYFLDNQIPTHEVPDTTLPPGMALYY